MKRIEKALSGLTRDSLTSETKESRIELRVSETEKEHIRQTAEGLGLSITEYLLGLHRYAARRLDKE